MDLIGLDTLKEGSRWCKCFEWYIYFFENA